MLKKAVNKNKSATRKSGLTSVVLDMAGKNAGEIDLPRQIFDTKVNSQLIAQSVRVYLANQRQGTASTKTRSEVAGSNRKIYRQKGTGRARHGSIKAPIFIGGGIVFGPQPRDFRLKLPLKMRKKALFSTLTNKFKNHDILIIENLEKMSKTKEMVKILQNLKLASKGKLAIKTLLVPSLKTTLTPVCRNIENLTVIPINLLNPYQVLSHEKIIFTKEAISYFSN